MLDARERARDPTGTTSLRRTWRCAAEMRLRQLRAQLRIAVIEQDILGLGGGIAQYTPPATRLKSFHEWFNRMANGALDGGWVAPYTAAAWQSGHLAAMRETGKMATLDQFASEHLSQLAREEFRGIAAALAQQVARASVRAVTRKTKPHRAYQELLKPFDKMAQHRARTNVNVIAVSAHNEAKLAAYREMGSASIRP